MGATPTDPRTFHQPRRRLDELTAVAIRAPSRRRALRQRQADQKVVGAQGPVQSTVATPFWRSASLRLVATCVLTLLCAALLNANALLKDAERKPFGPERDFWMATWTPFANVSSALYLDRPRAWLDEFTGHGPPRGIEPRAWAAGISSYPDAPAPPQSKADEPARLLRTPSVDDPLRLWAGGDSMSSAFGPALARMASETGLVAAAYDAELSSGLTRPDFFDWPAHFAEIATTSQPELFVILLGANDAQAIRAADGTVYQPETAGWVAEYRNRVRRVMTTLDAPGRVVIWVGLPIMETEGFSRRMAVQNGIYEEEAARRQRVEYFNAWALFSEDGRFSAFLDVEGTPQAVRMTDGVHLTKTGAEMLARAVLQRIAIDAPALAPPSD